MARSSNAINKKEVLFRVCLKFVEFVINFFPFFQLQYTKQTYVTETPEEVRRVTEKKPSESKLIRVIFHIPPYVLTDIQCKLCLVYFESWDPQNWYVKTPGSKLNSLGDIFPDICLRETLLSHFLYSFVRPGAGVVVMQRADSCLEISFLVILTKGNVHV